MSFSEREGLGDPDLNLSGLSLWVHGRQFPDSEDYWDGNWLRVTAYCAYPDSAVRTSGSIVHPGELVGLLEGCEQLDREMKGQAALACIEPNLRVDLEMEWNGGIKVRIQITPDQLAEQHSFTAELDQTYLPGIIRQCQSLLERYPVRAPIRPEAA